MKRESDPDILSSQFRRYSVTWEVSPDDLEAFGVVMPPELAGAVFKRKVEFAAGRFCVAKAMGNESVVVPIGADRAPQWPAGVIGSITHVEGFASAAIGEVGNVRGVGIDSEQLLELKSAEELLPEFGTAAEVFPELPFATSVTLLFSAKESIYKCFYPTVKKFFGFEDVVMTAVNLEMRVFRFRLEKTLAKGLKRGAEFGGRFAFNGGYVHTAIEWI